MILSWTCTAWTRRWRAPGPSRRFSGSAILFWSGPLISIVIPNKDHMEDLSRCVESIVNKSTYENYEIVIVENNSETKEIFDYYKALEHNPKIRVVKYEGRLQLFPHQ